MITDATTGQAIQIIVVVVLGTVALTLLLVLAGWVVMAFALMSLFRKVGVKPWIAWVPYYRTWVWLELGGQQGWLALLSLVGAGMVASIFLYIGMYRTTLDFRRDSGFFVLGIFFPYAWAFILGGRTAVYEPGLLAWSGYPPPTVGYGSIAPHFANDVTVR
ncbi:DUF5684 domain-containing protein [Herbiconiux sp. CPCC 205763]|uniref:DUF5684 domain-containing protein n=1 Tax=Herbiconiux aconitum TaxID=2970913 RepID=A0ABT2GSY9_9MICO|nr:DUF5684 domain-containing protein [Herbiconiux aconitum]MCS5718054.1 DUF5684 domain-containing protein [Herbiconiux aconitum]